MAHVNPVVQYILHTLLRGYRKGYGLDLNTLEDTYQTEQERREWIEAVEWLASVAESDAADTELKRLRREWGMQ